MRVVLAILCGVLLGCAVGRTQGEDQYQQYYPNIPTEVVFENDRILVQKVVLQPGEWEGIHAHSGNQLYVMLTDGQSTVRFGDQETTAEFPAGSVGWMDAIELSERHESGNTGDTAIELLWVNFKD